MVQEMSPVKRGPGRSVTRPSRKQDILDTFARHVAERGYDRVALREIAEELDISKGTIVHHFGSKEQMLRDLHTFYMERRIRELGELLELVDTPRKQLAAIIFQNFVALRDDNVATVAFAREIVRFASDDEMEPARRLRQDYADLVKGVIEQGIEDGSFRAADSQLITLQVFGTFNWVWTWLRPDGEWTIDHIAATFIDGLLGGLLVQEAGTQPFVEEWDTAAVVHKVMDRR
jgi:AcrR family transcriptional regulator